MTATSAGKVTRERVEPWRLYPGLFRPITPFQQRGLLAFLIISVVDVVFSAFLIFGTGGYVEGNPALAWAGQSLLLFVAAGLALKAIGIGMLALLVSFANYFFTVGGDTVVIAAIGTTMALLLLMLIL